MSKKNKKQTKINQRIRKIFDDDPFDVGVERVSSETLSALFHTLGIYDVEFSKDVMLRAIRKLWSQEPSDFRADVLNFFIANGEVYESDKQKVIALERVDKIYEILETLDVSQEEEAELIEMFSGLRSKKITLDKMQAKLNHIRFEAKKHSLEKALDGFFDIDDSFEFNASLRYKIYQQHFHKILTLNTKPYTYAYLNEHESEEIISKVNEDKETAIHIKQKSIENFIANLDNPHVYLTDKEIETALRASPPKTQVSFPSLKVSILKSLLELHLDVIDVSLHDKELLVKIKESVLLPYSNVHVPYELELHIDLNGLLETVWNGEVLDFHSLVDEAKREHEEVFLQELDALVVACGNYAILLHFTPEELHQKVYEFLVELLPRALVISAKVARKTTRIFIYNIQEQLIKKQRQALLARTIRDFKNLFPMAREMRRKLILHIGPTNSGKTYQAMQKLRGADTGYYLAPLRLLALEGYEGLKEQGIDASLITGEEQIVNEEATHISSTIEMLNFDVDVDVCVIDEVQMIDDRDRGWAWANAIIGTPAKEIIMTGSSNVKDAIIALAEYLGEELEIREFERKNPLRLLETVTEIADVHAGTAIVAFSRKDVLRLKQNFSSSFAVSVVYGNLSPEVRREEARKFREGESDILIATDAIAMGMNLPIKTLLFSKAEKFDGVSQRNLFPSEIHQISGRAGRYGLEEEGFVGALNPEALKIIKKNFYKDAKIIKIPFKVMANLEHIKLVSSILEEESLEVILRFFIDNMEFNGPFYASSLEDMLLASEIVDKFDLDIATKYHLACAPLTLKSVYIVEAYESYIQALERKIPVSYTPPTLFGEHAQTTDELLRAEDMVKEISLYLWLTYRFGDYFVDEKKARTSRGILNKYIEKSLHQATFKQTCRMCKAALPLNSTYSICQNCFKKNYTRNTQRRGKRYS
ncbi:helicase [Sulfurimonas sp. SAG-AH-194-I05]|nr:helicase-related protein [Sulfurimonas sp. SAG-AH-194-I05]MDF1875255.1 helicase [Sulfurimonas sp. SAG-AH-194-I05]